MIDFSTPLAGLNRAEATLNKSAAKIASYGVDSGGDTVDLSAEMIALLEAKNTYAANTKVVEAQNQMAKNLVSLLG